MIDIENKYAFITGSSRGIGQKVALELARLGCNVIVHGRTPQSTDKTLEMLKDYDIESHSVFGDLGKEDKVNKLIDQVKKLGVRVDILYNNAAIMRPYKEDIWTHSYEDWLETYKVNVVALYKLCSAFIPDMINNGFGRVVNLTSRIADQPQLAPYGASKWAVDKLSQDIAFSLENTNVRLNYLNPGWLKTDMGGSNAENEIKDVIPGALVPVLVDDNGPNGTLFSAMDYTGKSLEDIFL